MKRDKWQCERYNEGHPAALDTHHGGGKEQDVSKMVKMATRRNGFVRN